MAEKTERDRSVVEQLYAAYRLWEPGASRADFDAKLAHGIALWADLKLGSAAPQVSEVLERRSADPGHLIRTPLVQEVIDTLSTMSLEDALTRVFNRRYFDYRLAQELERARREQSWCSLIMADIDGFKSINDTFGHDVGDEVLKAVAKNLQETVRIPDILTRYGGEEFAVILPGADLNGAIGAAERLRARVAEHTAGAVAAIGKSHPVTLSFGVATSPPEDFVSPEDIIRAADAALYEAKRSGKNCVRPVATDRSVLLAARVGEEERKGLFE